MGTKAVNELPFRGTSYHCSYIIPIGLRVGTTCIKCLIILSYLDNEVNLLLTFGAEATTKHNNKQLIVSFAAYYCNRAISRTYTYKISSVTRHGGHCCIFRYYISIKVISFQGIFNLPGIDFIAVDLDGRYHFVTIWNIADQWNIPWTTCTFN